MHNTTLAPTNKANTNKEKENIVCDWMSVMLQNRTMITNQGKRSDEERMNMFSGREPKPKYFLYRVLI